MGDLSRVCVGNFTFFSDSETSGDESQSLDVVGGGSTVSRSNFLLCMERIMTKHGTSDSEGRDWIRLIKDTFPNAAIPSYKTSKRKNILDTKQFIISRVPVANGECVHLNFIEELNRVVRKNFEAIVNYQESKNDGTDLPFEFIFQPGVSQVTVPLILNSDGVRVIQSKNRSLWPIWLSIGVLPPVLRSSFNNIVLAALWFGVGKPEWSPIFEVSSSFSSVRNLSLMKKSFSKSENF